MILVNGREGYDQPRDFVAAMASNTWALCSIHTSLKACERDESHIALRRIYTIEYANTSLYLLPQKKAAQRLGYE